MDRSDGPSRLVVGNRRSPDTRTSTSGALMSTTTLPPRSTATPDQPVTPAAAPPVNAGRLQASTLCRRALDACLLCGSPRRHAITCFDGYHLDQCDDCGLAYVSDPPTPAELKRYYSFAAGYHTEFATSETIRQEYLQRGRDYLPYLARHLRCGRVLDVGCSAGFFLQIAREHGWDVAGLELSSDTAQMGREQFSLPIEEGDLLTHPYQDHSFDAVTLWDVIEHLPDPLAALRSAWKLLTPGGCIALSTPNIDGLYPKLSYYPGEFLRHWTHAEPPGHLCQFSARTLRRMLERAGFEFVWQTTRAIPLNYSFGDLRPMLRMPKRLAYAAAFAPIAAIAPWVGMGDEVVMVARKPR